MIRESADLSMGFQSLALLPRPCLELRCGQKLASESQDLFQLCPLCQKTQGVGSGTDQGLTFSPDYKQLTIFSDSDTCQIKNIY